jgi:glycosyltransferase involved in cell wall biosynthesis
LYAALAADGRIQLKVFFGSTAGLRPYFDPGFGRDIQWSGNLTDGYDFEFLPGAETADPARAVDGHGLAARLREFDPDVVQFYGFHHRLSRRGLAWATRNRRRTLLVSDSELRTRRSWLTRMRKRLSVPLLLRFVDGFLTVGDRNEDYYSSYGANRSRFFRSPFPIDTDLLDAAWENRVLRRKRMREALGIEEGTVLLLTVGKLTRRKRPVDVLQALSKVTSRSAHRLVAVFAGDGPEMAMLEEVAKTVGPDRVRFPGFVNTDQLADYYLAADILVHPSGEDPHPMATSEAICCGLPAVVSDRVGSVGPTDDVRLGENGLEYPVGDTDALAASIERLVLDGPLRARMSERSRAIGKERGLDASVEGFVRAVNATH